MALYQYFKKVDGNFSGTSLPDPQGELAKEVPLSAISAANTEVAVILQPSAAGTKAARGTNLKSSPKKKAEIGKHAAEHGVLATIRYCATKLPVPLKESSVRNWKDTYTAELRRLRQKRKDDAKVKTLPGKRRGHLFLFGE